MNPSFSLLATAFLGSVLCLASGMAQQDAPMNPPPLAQPASVSVYAGKSVQIPLQASGRTPGQIRFIIRSRPSHGTLGEIRTTGRNTAVILYTRKDQNSLQPDSFRYAVQAVDSPVSAAAEVLISVTEEAPRLKAPKELSFGEVFLGDAFSRTITVKNEGGGRLLGQLDAEEAFTLQGTPNVPLSRGEERQVTLLFRPVREGASSGFLSFDTTPRAGVQLQGSARSPLQIEPSTSLALSREAATTLTIRNISPTTRKVSLSAPTGIKVLSSLELAPEASASMELTVLPSHLTAIDGDLTIASGGVEKRIPLTAFAAPPLLRAFPAGGLDFGSLSVGQKVSVPLRLANLGGADARIQATLPEGVIVEPSLSSALLSPAEERLFHVSFEASKAGPVEEEMVIEASGAPVLKVPLRGEVAPPASITSVAPSPRGEGFAILPEIAAPPAPMRPDFLGVPPPLNPSDLPPINSFSIRKADPHVIQVAWPKPQEEISRYIVEKRRLESTGDGPPRIIWEAWRDVEIRPEENDMLATFRSLPANASWFIRVSFVDAAGKTSAPSPNLRIGTPPAPRSYGLYWLGAILLLGVGFAVWKKVSAHREFVSREDAERISRLE